MNILISSKIDFNKTRNETSCSIDLNIFNFLNICYKKKNNFLINTFSHDIDLVVISGGNNLINKDKADFLRFDMSKKFINFALQRSIPILGICYGAQLLAYLCGSKIIKIDGHVKKRHKVFSEDSSVKIVNSYHNYAIKEINQKKIQPIFYDNKKNIECFNLKNKNVLGIMWHPERNKVFDNGDIKMVRSLCI